LRRKDEILHAIRIPFVVTSIAAIIQAVCWAGNPAPPNQEPSPATAGERLVKANDCSSCHALDRPMVGPSYDDIAKRYQGKADVADKLAAKIKQGGSGTWGTVPMIPHPDLTDAQLKQMVEWILAQRSGAADQPKAPAKMYAYPLADGTTAKLDFPLFVEGQQPKVTKAVFHGYEQFDSYCYRCHGQDATGSETAPDLRNSLKMGMTEQQFLSVAMAGRAEKGMPSWAGFLSEDEVKEIYEYVKGRSLDLVPVGRPRSEMD
jgi:cytochrome c